MNYKIDFEDDNCVEIRFGDVIFFIYKKTNTLYKLKNVGDPTDIVIPNKFPSGHQIKDLYSSTVDGTCWSGAMVQGFFNTITISNGIFVGCGAFENADVKKVVWNDCARIPNFCFYGSNIKEIANIANVDEILDYAFATTSIVSFDWPAKCRRIPQFCFASSMLTEINNIDGITAIGKSAFADTDITVLDLSGTNINYMASEALEGLPDGCVLTLPYYINNEDFATLA